MFKFPFHPTYAFALPAENRPGKNFNKFYLSRSLAFNSQSIARFDCHKSVCLSDGVQKWLWI